MKTFMMEIKYEYCVIILVISAIFNSTVSGQPERSSPVKSFLERLGLSQRVVGGKPVAKGAFPWVVFIQANHKYKNNTQTSNLCGGSLIHSRYVI